jgi:general stress protein YciG
MDASKQREIASKGGRAAHAKGTAHEFTSDEARVAGRKGGEAVSRDRAHMAAIGREGGHSRGARARAAATGGDTNLGGIYNPRPQSDETTGSQPFVRQANEDRGSFESPNRNAGFGSQERRPNNDRDRNDNSNEGSSFSDRDRDRL